MKTIIINDENHLQNFAQDFVNILKPGIVIYLNGILGVGKTTFVRYCLYALGYQGKVKSPTYTIIEPYEIGTLFIYHFDLYRLQHARELEQLGLSEYFTEQSICFVEWPDKGAPLLPQADLDCYIEFAEDARKIHIKANTQKGKIISEQFSAK